MILVYSVPTALFSFGFRYPPISELQTQMESAGLKVGPSLSLSHEKLFKSEVFYDKEGPFREEWRHGDR